MEQLLTILPNLGIGVVAVLALGYLQVQHNIAIKAQRDDFLKSLDEMATRHERGMQEREVWLRNVEADVRKSLTEQLTQNTVALMDAAKVLARVVRHLDGNAH